VIRGDPRNLPPLLGRVSSLRLGIESGIVKADIRMVNELLIITQPGHIQKLFMKEMGEPERDQKRAEIIRGKLG